MYTKNRLWKPIMSKIRFTRLIPPNIDPPPSDIPHLVSKKQRRQVHWTVLIDYKELFFFNFIL